MVRPIKRRAQGGSLKLQRYIQKSPTYFLGSVAHLSPCLGTTKVAGSCCDLFQLVVHLHLQAKSHQSYKEVWTVASQAAEVLRSLSQHETETKTALGDVSSQRVGLMLGGPSEAYATISSRIRCKTCAP